MTGSHPRGAAWLVRLRRFLLDSGSRRLDFRHPAARVPLALLALGAVAALAAASWIAYVDSRILAATVTDPRDLYVENARRRIQAATDAALTGAAPRGAPATTTLVIRVNDQGGLAHVAVSRSAGDPELDRLARRIVGAAAPFDPFPPEMRRTTRTVEIVSEFRFR